MGIRLLSRQKTEEQQLQSPEIVMFDSSDDLKVQAWNYGSSNFSNEWILQCTSMFLYDYEVLHADFNRYVKQL
jgi:hypothetical protein